MSRNEIKVLLGATKENTIVFANINLEDYFSVSFDEVSPFVASDEYLKERFEGSVECMEAKTKLDLLEMLDCKFSELEDEYFNYSLRNYGVEGIVDISLYAESYTIEGIEDEVYFDSVSCGQHDTRDILLPIDGGFSECLFKMWDGYHLQGISEELKTSTKQLIEDYKDKIGEEEIWIETWLKTIELN